MPHSTVFERSAPSPAAVRDALSEVRASAFWLDDVADERVLHPPLAGAVEADLVVVGGGYAGLWTALRALEREPGRTVVVLEGQRIAWAASGRNGGFCEASLTHGEENGQRRWPEELDTLERLGAQNLDDIESTVARYGWVCHFERTGTLTVAVEPHQVDWLDDPLDQDQVRAEVDSPTYLAGQWDRRSTALVHPARLALELARTVVDLGGTLHERSVVRALESDGDRVVVRTDDAQVRARHVVLATNAFPSLLRRNALMTVPVHDYALMTQPLTPEQLASIGWTHRQGIADLANQFHYYRLSSDNRVLFGGYDAIYRFGHRLRAGQDQRPATSALLASHFLTTFPQLEGVRFSHAWGGAIDTCTRFCAFFGTARAGRVAYAAGFTGLGVGATRFAADVLLDLLDGHETERTALRMVRERPLPFPPEPLAAIGVGMTKWSLDRADHREGRRNLLLRTLDAMGLGFDS
ncbi:NAD(P)/FAD-dependent oxidoreductase [Cellulomonas soli]|uniref:NAD(P)/FAD-dependent oxidoreductase n=1 Tax=Cellulomonas soli TaxID=931535 RepID=UPI003F863E63